MSIDDVATEVDVEIEGEGLNLTAATAAEKNVTVAIMERHERRETPHNMCPEVHPPAS